MRLKLTNLNNPDSIIGKIVLYILREDLMLIREGNILAFAEDYECVKIGVERYIDPYSWEFSANITLISILGDRK